VELRGLYLSEPYAPPADRSRTFVYANYIASLDGRISLPDPRTSRRGVPPAIGNARDWRLFQELAACADAIVVSGRYVRDRGQSLAARSFPVSDQREYADLLEWRRAHGRAPQPAIVIVSASLDLPPLYALTTADRAVYVATGEAADPRKTSQLASEGVRVLGVGGGTRVEGGKLIEALARDSLRNVALIGGGELLHALVADDRLDRLYLTLACRLLGGTAFDTLLTGPVLERAAGFKLEALHYDAETSDGTGVEQLFAILDRKASAS
jgi:riboflavin biosynthesis pyrimidine reductase